MTDHDAQPPLFVCGNDIIDRLAADPLVTEASIPHDALDGPAHKVLWWPWKDRYAMEEYDELPPMFHRGRSVVNGPSVDFFEDSEPVAEAVAAFEAGEKHLTQPPTQGCGWCAPSP